MNIHTGDFHQQHYSVLIADDNRFIRAFLRDILLQDGYEIIEACNGLETIAVFQEHLPDLILLDVIMPEIDGCSVCAKIRGLASGKQVPILMLTSREDNETIDHAFRVGANDYITKDFNPTVLRYRIKRLLQAQNDRKIVSHLAWLERLNVIGEMAASIGHEVRNPITTVRGFLQHLSQKKDLGKYTSYFDLMIEELDRANDIITEFLSLAKDKAMVFLPAGLNDIINEFIPVLQANALLNDCSIELKLTEIPDVLLDKQSIRQLILNLTRNSIEAMPQGGRITISTYCQARKVVLMVADEGMGIPEELMDKLGTPFISSKDTGVGLGLAICYRIVQRHDATISVESDKGKGTTFTIGFNLPKC